MTPSRRQTSCSERGFQFTIRPIVTLERGPEIGPSVDGSFVNAGYPHAVINIGSWPYADEAYHREDDIPERVDIDHLSKATRLHLAAALTLDRA